MKFIACITCLFFFLTCNGQESKKSGEGIRLDFTKAADEAIKMSSVIDNVRAIPLETKDDFLVSSISKMRYVDEKFFIFDSRQKAILVFDKDGKALFKINNSGGGPDEYVEIRGFDVNEKLKQIVLNVSLQKLFFYDFEGHLIKKENLKITSTDIAWGNDAMIFDTGHMKNDYEDTEGGYCFVVKPASEDKYKGYMPFSFEEMGRHVYRFQQPRSFVHVADEILFFEPFSNMIYSVVGDKANVKYLLDFGNKNIPSGFFSRYNDMDKAVDELEDGSYAYAFNSVWENDKYLGIDCTYDANHHTLVYDKRQKKLFTKGLKDDILICWPEVAEATDQYLVGYRFADDLLYQFDEKAEMPDLKRQLLTSINEESNPVVFLYYFK